MVTQSSKKGNHETFTQNWIQNQYEGSSADYPVRSYFQQKIIHNAHNFGLYQFTERVSWITINCYCKYGKDQFKL